MSEKLCALKKVGGGTSLSGIEAKYKSSVSQITSTYQYVATGMFVNAIMSRGSVSSVPKVQFFVKDSGGNYVAVSNAIDISTTMTNNFFNATSNIYGEIYIRKNSGSDFSPSWIRIGYVEAASS